MTAIYGHQQSLGGSPTNPRLVWSPTIRKCTTDMEFGNYTLLMKLTPGDNCHKWSRTILRMVPHQPKDGHPPSGSVLQTWNLTLNSQKKRMKIVATMSLPAVDRPNADRWKAVPSR